MFYDYVQNLKIDTLLELFLTNKGKLLPVSTHDFAQIQWNNWNFIELYPEPNTLKEIDIFFNPHLQPVTPLKKKYDAILVRSVLGYLPNILSGLTNLLSLIGKEGHLLLAWEDRQYCRQCLRTNSSFCEALTIFNNKGQLGAHAFDAAFNLSAPYDTASFWNAYPITSREGYSFDDATKLARDVDNGKYTFLPYWVFDAPAFLSFLQQILLSGLLSFSFNFIIPTETYDKTFYIDISPIDINNYDVYIEINKISNAIQKLYTPQNISDSDMIDELFAKIDEWRTEFYKLKHLYNITNKNLDECQHILAAWKNEFFLLKSMYMQLQNNSIARKNKFTRIFKFSK